MKLYIKKTLGIYIKFLKRHKLGVFFIFIGTLMAVTGDMMFPVLYGKIIDTMVTATDRGVAFNHLMTLLAYLIILEIAETASWRISVYTVCRIQPKIMQEITDESFANIHKHSYRFFSDNFAGSLVKKVTRMTRSFEDITDALAFQLIPTIFRTCIALGVLFYIHIYLGLALLIWTISFVGINYYIAMYKALKYDLKVATADTKITAQLADTISNNTNIKLFASHETEIDTFQKVTENWLKKAKKSWFFNSHIEFVQAFTMIALEIVMLYIGMGLWERGDISVGMFTLIQLYLFNIFRNLWDFGRTLRHLYSRFTEAAEMTEILETPFEIQDTKGAKDISIRHGKIEFQNVSFAYDPENGVIDHLSFKINPSEKVAFIGPSGGGKSTIVKLVLRLFNVDSGQIVIDGQNIAEVTQDSLRQNIALVPQDPILFHRTLMENIRYGRHGASDEEVFAASKLAHCHEFVSKFPKGYDTLVGERGIKLSGGERQRVAIARAILANTKILILDEATSNLDSASERLIQDALKNLMKNKTTIVIAHRLSTIVSMDKIFVLEDGKIIEQGSHNSLIRKETSLYKDLWDLQVGGYLT